MASDAHRGVQSRRHPSALAAVAGLRTVLWLHGRETDQWYPELVYDNHPVEAPATPEQGYHLSKDLADKAIEFIRDSTQVAPGKPWFTYLCPGPVMHRITCSRNGLIATRGKFDMGYERYREIVLENQKNLGIVPAGTELSPVNPYLDVKGPNGQPWPLQDTVRPWDSLSDEEKRLFARMAEVFAGFLSYTDAQIGRVLDHLEESGQLDNTIVVVIGDNGASGEGGPNGSVNEAKFFNGYVDTVEDSMRFYDELGLPSTYNHYPIGWAMAFNTPLQALQALRLPRRRDCRQCHRLVAHGNFRSRRSSGQLHQRLRHHSDGVRPGRHQPARIREGNPQKPLDGGVLKRPLLIRMPIPVRRPSSTPCSAPADMAQKGGSRTRCTPHLRPGGRTSTRTAGSCSTSRTTAVNAGIWQLNTRTNWPSYRLCGSPKPRSTTACPCRIWSMFEMVGRTRPTLGGERTSYTYYPHTAPVPVGACVNILGRSFSVLAEVTIHSADVSGVLLKQGAGHGGYVLFIEDGKLQFVYNFFGELEQRVIAPDPVPQAITSSASVTPEPGRSRALTPVGDATLH